MINSETVNLTQSICDDASVQDIMYNLYVLGKHRKAMADIESGMLYTTKELRKTLGANNETVIVD